MPTPIVNLARSLARFDPAPRHRGPRPAAVVTATAASVLACLLADVLLVRIGTAVFPDTRGYEHFEFPDYAKLTVIGVVIGCLAWPAVARLSSDPRWIFLRLAVLVTAVLLLPDLWIWAQGQPGQAVLVLIWMHLAIGLITYNLLVGLAPVRPPPGS
jgi:H+/Cl- antiporter ClcA